MSVSTDTYRPEIDGLRALAVVAVIINHIESDWLQSGYLGVDIFFVISGYVITLSLARRRHKSFQEFIAGFYERRIKRLIPSLLAFVILTSLLTCLFNPDPELELRTGLSALFGVSNLYLLRQSTDYFATSTTLNPFVHTWSLGVEEQFYLLFPVIVWVFGFCEGELRRPRRLFAAIVLLSIVSLLGFAVFYREFTSEVYFIMPTRFWEMSAGCLAYLGLKQKHPAVVIFNKIPAEIVLAGIIAVLFLPQEMAVVATFCVVLLTSILVCCMNKGSRLGKFFQKKPVVGIGIISYSLYLWHWGILAISRSTIGIHWWSIPFQLLLMFGLAILSYHYLEEPLRRASWGTKRWKTIAKGVGFSLLGSGVVLGMAEGTTAKQSFLYLGRTNTLQKEFSARSGRLSVENKTCNIFEQTSDSTDLKSECYISVAPSSPTIYLLGDSHAEQFAETVAHHARKQGIAAVAAWGNECVFPAAVIRDKNLRCYELQSRLERSLVRHIKTGDTVIISNALYARFSGYWGPKEDYTNIEGDDIGIEEAAGIFSAKVQSLAEELVARGAKVVIFIGGAQFSGLQGKKHPGFICTRQWYRPNVSVDCLTNQRVFTAQRDKGFGWTKDWADGKKRFVWDAINNQSCDGEFCFAEHYEDSNHFSDYYADYLFRELVRLHPESLPKGG